jgi:hypothetical protein
MRENLETLIAAWHEYLPVLVPRAALVPCVVPVPCAVQAVRRLPANHGE